MATRQAIEPANGHDADTSVEKLEEFFLRGSFRQALQLANQSLEQQQQQPHPAAESSIRLLTPVSFDGTTRFLSFHWDSAANDRAAAIALQSWYELAQISGSRELQYLQPFLDAYSTTAPQNSDSNDDQYRPMSLELLVLWIQFCRTMSHVEISIGLAVEVLQHVRSGTRSGAAIEREASCREIIVLLFKGLLPFCENSTAVLDALRRLEQNPSSNERRSKHKYRVFSSPQKDSVQACLQFCNTRENDWPESLHDAFMECRVELQSMLRDMHRSSKQNRPLVFAETHARDLDESSKLLRSRQLSLRSIESWKHVSVALVGWIRDCLQRLRSSGAKERRKLLQSIAFTLCFVVCWRKYRQRVAIVSQRVMMTAIAQPLLEIMQAFGLAQRH